ncbi:uncharacterized protein LACBIDRAFT_316280 [Laccaria bicolor S238N-H82]|uniref:Predicted protein n=1 Tax=Laccaria bicolor (strain S238N-H82 / ATCC MYA-4686) TaxID=486041 RepID=B0E0L7_LACBS|nr:uncharacterized protein LACBIDRAFT_316280 [Laccaria bicolor S238N-H82]EDQ99608.1 predicted protein [Laccaria bicolor S238N-H82]|eukprot:XP_001889719.1 predicted protein [Laccaria bicolor S238N-H82]
MQGRTTEATHGGTCIPVYYKYCGYIELLNQTTTIDPPTTSVFIHTDGCPLSGQEGTKLTSQLIRGRICKETKTNAALTVLTKEKYAGSIFQNLVMEVPARTLIG